MSTNAPGGDPRFGPPAGFGGPDSFAATPTPVHQTVPLGQAAPAGTGAFLSAPPPVTTPRPRLGAPRWLGPTVLGVIAALAVSMFGIYWFQGQKNKADTAVFKRTTLSAPDSVLGLARGVGPGVSSVEARVNLSLAASGALQPVSAGYIDTDGNAYALVAAGKRVTAPKALDAVAIDAVDRFATGIGTGGTGTTISSTEYPAGRLGGVLRCGATDVGGIPATFCVAVDEGAVVQMVIANGDPKAAAVAATELREAVVKRSA